MSSLAAQMNSFVRTTVVLNVGVGTFTSSTVIKFAIYVVSMTKPNKVSSPPVEVVKSQASFEVFFCLHSSSEDSSA